MRDFLLIGGVLIFVATSLDAAPWANLRAAAGIVGQQAQRPNGKTIQGRRDDVTIPAEGYTVEDTTEEDVDVSANTAIKRFAAGIDALGQFDQATKASVIKVFKEALRTEEQQASYVLQPDAQSTVEHNTRYVCFFNREASMRSSDLSPNRAATHFDSLARRC